MSIVSKLFGIETRAHPSDTSTDWARIFGSGWSSPAGVDVTPDSSLSSGAVFACVRVLAESVASLPLITYKRLPDGGKERATGHPIYRLLHDAPNPEMTSFEFRETMMSYLCRWGNAFAEIERNGAGYPVGLWPLRPSQMGIERTNGRIIYHYSLSDGQELRLPARSVMHQRFMGTGWWGDSPVRLGLRSLGLDLAAEEYGSRYFGNGAQPGIVLKHPGLLGPEAAKNIKESWAQQHQGLSNAQRVSVLEEGMEIDKLTSPPDEAQFLQTRKFQRSVIAGWFRIPPHMIGDLDNATFSNIEEQGINFVTHTLRPWLVRTESRYDQDLLLDDERKEYVIEHLVDALLRGNTESRYNSYSTAILNAILSPNEVRAMENLNPYDGGDTYLRPLNLSPVGEEPAEIVDEDRSVDACTCGHDHAGESGHVETRADDQQLTNRQALARSFSALYEDAAQRVINREAADLGRALPKQLNGTPAEFRQWLTEFYEKLAAAIPGYYQASMKTLTTQTVAAVAAELDEYVPTDFAEFITEYLENYAQAYTIRHQKELLGIVQNAEQGDDVAKLANERITHWEENEVRQESRDQPFEAVNAVAIAAYSAVGVRTLMWLASGDSCPFCQSLSGETVAIERYFLTAGSTINAGGGSFNVGRNMRHGPIHGGCDCIVVAA
jgi:HK97 family phage portal protein